MSSAEKIRKLFAKSGLTVNSKIDDRIISDALTAFDKSEKIKSVSAEPNIWRMIVRSRLTKLAAAAVIVLGLYFGLNSLGGPDMAGVVWGDVVTYIDDVDYVHMYIIKSRGNDFFGHAEAWHAHGKTVIRGPEGGVTYDDGWISHGFDWRGMLTVRKPSILADGQSFLAFFGGGFLSDKDRQFNEQIPTSVGDDFLIYTFDPPPGSKWFESTSITITVGRNSLLPIQMKIHIQDAGYDLFIFDYEAPEKPPEFFEPPSIEAPNGTGQVVLDGEKVMIDIADAPGLKTAIVRLHSESVDNAGRASYAMDVTFITEEGFNSRTIELKRFKPDEAKQCGVSAMGGGFNDWPDGKYRNVRFSPWLRPTDTEDTYIVEIRCRIETKTN